MRSGRYRRRRFCWWWLAFVTAGCVSCATDPWADPQGVQLPLFGDRKCSDPIGVQVAEQCCGFHDNAYAAGGTEQDRAIADAEFLLCMLMWDVPPDIAELRWWAVRRHGKDSFHHTGHRTRGHPK